MVEARCVSELKAGREGPTALLDNRSMSKNESSGDECSGKPWADASTMRHLYLTEELPIVVVAERLGCSRKTVQRWLKRHGIESRGHSQEPRNKLDLDEERIRDLYENQMWSGSEIAEEMGCDPPVIYKRLRRMGIERREHGEAIAARYRRSSDIPIGLDPHGYERISHTYRTKTERASLHRLIAVAEYGFDAVRGNEVHHVNGVEWDNRPANLEVKSPTGHRRHHAKQRRKDGNGPRYSDKETLQYLYYDQDMTMKQMGDELGCSLHVIQYWMDQHELPRKRTNAKYREP